MRSFARASDVRLSLFTLLRGAAPPRALHAFPRVRVRPYRLFVFRDHGMRGVDREGLLKHRELLRDLSSLSHALVFRCNLFLGGGERAALRQKSAAPHPHRRPLKWGGEARYTARKDGQLSKKLLLSAKKRYQDLSRALARIAGPLSKKDAEVWGCKQAAALQGVTKDLRTEWRRCGRRAGNAPAWLAKLPYTGRAVSREVSLEIIAEFQLPGNGVAKGFFVLGETLYSV